MERFDINDNNEFQKNPEGSIKIDRMLSDEEKKELSEALEGEKNDIHDATNGKLAELLHTDVMPHLENSDLSADVKSDLRALSEKYPLSVDLGIQIPEDLKKLLSGNELNLSIEQAVGNIESYIAKELTLPSDSNISPDEHQTIIGNIGTMLQGNIEGIDAIVRDKIQDNPNLSLSELKWIVNSSIQEYFDEIRDNVLMPTKALLSFSGEQKQNELLDNVGAGASRESWSKSRIRRSQENLYMNMEMLKEALLSEGSSIDDISYQYEMLRDREFNLDEFDTEMYAQAEDNLDISLLSEADKKIESQAMFYFLCSVGFQCIPFLGAAAGIPLGIQDTFSSEDATMIQLKKMGLVPEQFNMEKHWVDNVAAGLGVALTAVGFQALTKSGKIAKAVKGIKNITPEIITSSLSLFASKMKLSDEAIDALKSLMGVEVDEIPVAANLNRAPVSGVENNPVFQRSIRHTPESYLEVGGRKNEYGFVDTNGQLHINSQALNTLSESEKRSVMKEFIAHERAHQAVMNLPEGKLSDIHESFLRNDVFAVIQESELYGLHFDRAMSPLDTTNEILAHMIGRMRVGKDVPDNFKAALKDAGIDDILATFGVNASRSGWNEAGGVRNTEKLAEAAYTYQSELFSEISHEISRIEQFSPELACLITALDPQKPNILETLSKVDFTNPKVMKAIKLLPDLPAEVSMTIIEKVRKDLGDNSEIVKLLDSYHKDMDDGTIMVPAEFWNQYINIMQELSTGVKSQSDAIHMNSDQLFQYIQNTVEGLQGRKIAKYLQENPQSIAAIKRLEAAHISSDSYIVSNDIKELKKLFESVGAENFSLLIKDIFKIPDTDTAKLERIFGNFEAAVSQARGSVEKASILLQKTIEGSRAAYSKQSAFLDQLSQISPEIHEYIHGLKSGFIQISPREFVVIHKGEISIIKGKKFESEGFQQGIRNSNIEEIDLAAYSDREKRGIIQSIVFGSKSNDSATFLNSQGERISTGIASDEVLAINGALSDPERITKAEEILGFSLTEKQADILLEAHYVDQGNNVQKGKILMRGGGFNKEEARILMDLGIAGRFNNEVIPFGSRAYIVHPIDGKTYEGTVLSRSENGDFQIDFGDFNIQTIPGANVHAMKEISDIISVKSFDELFHTLRSLSTKGVYTRDGETFFGYNELINIIQDVRDGRLPLKYITNNGELRNTVKNLIHIENSPIRIQREAMVKRLWPNGINSHVAQGKLGNCYFIASLRSIKVHPEAQKILTRMIEFQPDGSATVRFPGDVHQREINITSDQLRELSEKGMSGDLGDRILERAYARLVHKQKIGVSDGEYTGKTMFGGDLPGEGDEGKMAFEGGHMYITFKEIFGNYGKETIIPNQYISEAFSRITPRTKDSRIISLGSLDKVTQAGDRADSYIYQGIDAGGNPIKLYHGHAYGVEDIDINNGRVLIVNPHDTANERFWMTFDQVQRYFNEIQAISLDIDSLMRGLESSEISGNSNFLSNAA